MTPRIPAPPVVAALAKLKDLQGLSAEFERRAGYPPELPSHWNPKPTFSAQLKSWVFQPHTSANLVDYVYVSDINLDMPRLLERLHEPIGRCALPTPSGTASIVNVCAYLKNIGISHLVVLAPSYFSVEAVAMAFGLSVSFLDLRRAGMGYKLPEELANQTDGKAALWLTYPVYGTSSYPAPSDVAAIVDRVPADSLIVLDEGLAYPDRSPIEAIRTRSRVLRISTPHKALCVNGEKVSFITFPSHLMENMEIWSDCFAAGIGPLGRRALEFVLGETYLPTISKMRRLTQDRLGALRSALSGSSRAETDECTDGYFVMLYWTSLPASLGDNISFLGRMLEASGALPYPASRNRHPPDCGFCFRVNLLRLDDAGLGGISRLVSAIDVYAASSYGALA